MVSFPDIVPICRCLLTACFMENNLQAYSNRDAWATLNPAVIYSIGDMQFWLGKP